MASSRPKINLPYVGIPSFCRFPVCLDLERLDADIAILGVPYDDGGSWRPGMRFAPRRIRECSMRYAPRGAKATGFYDFETDRPFLEREVQGGRIADVGDVDVVYTKPMETQANVTEFVGKVLERGAFPVAFGGDHSITFPILRAYAIDPIDVVMIDGHLDFTDEAGGITHAGMNPFRRASELPNVRKIVHVGIRGLRNSKKVRDEALANGNTIITVPELRKKGIRKCLDRAGRLRNVYFSIDIDGLDPTIAPACSGSEPGGILYRETLDIMDAVTERAAVSGFDIMEVNPNLDLADLTSSLAALLALRFLGMATSSPHWKRRPQAQAAPRASRAARARA
jgi:agmatinase